RENHARLVCVAGVGPGVVSSPARVLRCAGAPGGDTTGGGGSVEGAHPAMVDARSSVDQPRRTAPVRSAATATAASLAAPASSAVKVRSLARKRSAKATDLRPLPTCSPV